MLDPYLPTPQDMQSVSVSCSADRYRIHRTCPMDSQCTTSVPKSKHTDHRHTQCNSSHLSSRYTFRRRTKYTSSDPCSIHTYRRRKICSPFRCRASADRYRIHRTCPMDSRCTTSVPKVETYRPPSHTMQLVALVIEIYLPTPHKIHVV